MLSSAVLMRAFPLATALPLQDICLLCTDVLFSLTEGLELKHFGISE
jgi:hypothetical protein